jgi:hypothetical protein
MPDGAFLDPGRVTDAVVEGVAYVGFVDMSGGSCDDARLASRTGTPCATAPCWTLSRPKPASRLLTHGTPCESFNETIDDVVQFHRDLEGWHMAHEHTPKAAKEVQS